MSIDNLVAAELITADGDVLDVSDDQHSDLFWGIRGGGGNFGVVTAFEYRAHDVPDVLGGLVAHPLAHAGDVIERYREVTATAPDELTAFLALLHAPDGSGHQAHRHAAVPLRRRRTGRARRRRPPRRPDRRRRHAQPSAVPGDQHDARRRLPRRHLQLLEVRVPARAHRRQRRRARRCLHAVPVADDLDRHRPLPRCHEPRRPDRHRLPAPRTRLQPRHPHPVDRPRRHQRQHQLDAADVRGPPPPHHRPGLRQQPLQRRRRDGPQRVRPELARLVELKRRYDPDNTFHLNHNIDPGPGTVASR